MTAEQAAWTVRSAEQAQVAFPVRVRGRVRLVKHVVTEEVTQTFTVRREELRVEEWTADPADAPLSWASELSPAGTEQDFEIVLHAEQVVASVAVVPVERVRVRTRVVETDVPVSTQLRTEQVEVLHDPPTPSTRDAPNTSTGTADGDFSRSNEEPA